MTNICLIPSLIWSISLRYFQWVPQHMTNICLIPTLIWSISLRYFQWVPQHMKKYLPDTHSYLEHLTKVLPMSPTTYEKIFARYPLLSEASSRGTSSETHNTWQIFAQYPFLSGASSWVLPMSIHNTTTHKKYLPKIQSYLEHLAEVLPISTHNRWKIFARSYLELCQNLQFINWIQCSLRKPDTSGADLFYRPLVSELQ